ncbi:hypothetical protein FRC10_006098 [Ceratobasidium sp. 414]|nr:hypothetical protein FRC10_006098 [Ceratobasidium sp. 414]
MNVLPASNSFYPIDQRQEFNNGGIRNYAPTGPNSSWLQIQKVSPAIPYYLDNIQHVEEQIIGLSRSHIHKNPDREGDIRVLMSLHSAADTHIEVLNRKIKLEDITKDYMAMGTRALKEKKLVEFAEQRELYFTGISDENRFDPHIYTPPITPLPSPLPFELKTPVNQSALLNALEELTRCNPTLLADAHTSQMGPTESDGPDSELELQLVVHAMEEGV